jgi:hypothetical protein
VGLILYKNQDILRGVGMGHVAFFFVGMNRKKRKAVRLPRIANFPVTLVSIQLVTIIPDFEINEAMGLDQEVDRRFG